MEFHMLIISFISLLLGGFVAGTFGALLGLGGGVLLIPFLVMVLDIPMHQAIATSIIAVIATSRISKVGSAVVSRCIAKLGAARMRTSGLSK